MSDPTAGPQNNHCVVTQYTQARSVIKRKKTSNEASVFGVEIFVTHIRSDS